MSSRTSSGKKTRKHTAKSKPILSPVQPQVIKVEIAPLPLPQPQNINVEFTAPSPQVSEAKKEGDGFDWNVAGFMSAAITLLGAALLFILGWAYEANWYGYFGISLTQIKVQPQDVLIQSLPGLVTLFSCFTLAVFSYTLFKYFASGFIDRVKIVTNKDLDLLLNRKKTQYIDFQAKDWERVLALTEVILLGLCLYIYFPRAILLSEGNTLYEIFYLQFILAMSAVGIIIFAFLVTVFGIGFIVLIVILLFQKRFLLATGIANKIKAPQRSFVIFIEVFLILLTSISLSSAYGIIDASQGIQTGGWKMPQVLISTSKTGDTLNLNCETIRCTYGLIGKDETNYILVDWLAKDQAYFKYSPGLYYIPNHENIYMIPGEGTP